MSKKVAQLVSLCKSQASGAYAKVKWVHDWLCDNARYDQSAAIEYGHYYAESALLEGVTVCQGYTLAARILLRTLLAGMAVALCACWLPQTIFSGEQQMRELMNVWHTLPPAQLVLIAAVKLVLVSLCIELGWRGGAIFPLIFSSAALGYAFAQIVGMDGNFAVAILTAALYARILRKPLAVVAILLLCFPLTYLPPLLLAAFVAAKLPLPRAVRESHA